VRADETALLKDIDVLHHGRQRHRKRRGELAHRCRPQAQPGDDRAPARIGERVEGTVEPVGSGSMAGTLANSKADA
jgi:hypothetical protein